PVALSGAWAGGGDVIAAEPVAVRAAPGQLGEVLDANLGDLVEDGDCPAFGGGWIGYLGYSAGGEALPAVGRRALPAWGVGWYEHVLRRHRGPGEWYFGALWTRRRARALERRFADLAARVARATRATPGPAAAPHTFGSF